MSSVVSTSNMNLASCIGLVIIGAGWNGICMVKTYHEVFPRATIRILDSAGSVGGCWAAERMYFGPQTNNWLGPYEFSYFPMTGALTDTRPEEHMSGSDVREYLRGTVKHSDIVP